MAMSPLLAAIAMALVAIAGNPAIQVTPKSEPGNAGGSSPQAKPAPCALVDLSLPIGVVNDKGMTASEFRACLQAAEEKGLRRILLDIAAPAGRDDSLVEYLDAIKASQSNRTEIVGFVREASAEGWCIALTCNRWTGTKESIAALRARVKRTGEGQGSGGFQDRRKPPEDGGGTGMGQGLGLSGGGGSGDWSTSGRSPKETPEAKWPAPSEATLTRLADLMKQVGAAEREPATDRVAALTAFGLESKPELELGDRFCATQRQLSELSGAVGRSEAELEKQETALKAVKQKDGPRAEGIQKLISRIKSRLQELRVKMAVLRSQP